MELIVRVVYRYRARCLFVLTTIIKHSQNKSEKKNLHQDHEVQYRYTVQTVVADGAAGHGPGGGPGGADVQMLRNSKICKVQYVGLRSIYYVCTFFDMVRRTGTNLLENRALRAGEKTKRERGGRTISRVNFNPIFCSDNKNRRPTITIMRAGEYARMTRRQEYFESIYTSIYLPRH